MRILAYVMMAGFSLSSLLLLILFGGELLTRLRRRHCFVRTDGTIVAIKTKTMTTRDLTLSPKLMHFPIIEFQRQNGQVVKFTSEVGDLGPETKYKVGQTIPVLYDTEGKIGPTIATWSGIWLPPLMGILSSLVFLIAVALIYMAFIKTSSPTAGGGGQASEASLGGGQAWERRYALNASEIESLNITEHSVQRSHAAPHPQTSIEPAPTFFCDVLCLLVAHHSMRISTDAESGYHILRLRKKTNPAELHSSLCWVL